MLPEELSDFPRSSSKRKQNQSFHAKPARHQSINKPPCSALKLDVKVLQTTFKNQAYSGLRWRYCKPHRLILLKYDTVKKNQNKTLHTEWLLKPRKLRKISRLFCAQAFSRFPAQLSLLWDRRWEFKPGWSGIASAQIILHCRKRKNELRVMSRSSSDWAMSHVQKVYFCL